MADKHTVHCRNGGKVVIDGDRVEVHLAGPLVLQRKHWTRYYVPAQEVERTLTYQSPLAGIRSMLEEAFRVVPQVVHRDPRGDEYGS